MGIAVVGAVPATIAALNSARNGRKTDHIEILVNGNSAKVRAELELAKHHVSTLETQVHTLEALVVKLSDQLEAKENRP